MYLAVILDLHSRRVIGWAVSNRMKRDQMQDSTFIGLDVHKATISVAVAQGEVGDFQRFDTPRQLMAYLGLTPSEYSSGATVRRGGITKA